MFDSNVISQMRNARDAEKTVASASPSHIESEMKRLYESMHTLEEGLITLAARLGPVLLAEPPGPACNDGKDHPEKCPIGEQIYSASEKIDSLRRLVGGLLDRLEI